MLIRFENNNEDSKILRAIMSKAGLEPDESHFIDGSNQDLAKSYKVTVYPTMILADDKKKRGIYKEFDRFEGVSNIKELKKFLDI